MRGVSAQRISAKTISTPSPEAARGRTNVCACSAGEGQGSLRMLGLCLRKPRAQSKQGSLRMLGLRLRGFPPTPTAPGTGRGVCACSAGASSEGLALVQAAESAHAWFAPQKVRVGESRGVAPQERRRHVSPPQCPSTCSGVNTCCSASF